MRRAALILAIILSSIAFAAAPNAAAGKNLAGKVVNRAALQNVMTYCVDTSNLDRGPVSGGDFPHPEAFDVREVIERDRKPNGLLSRLPWKLEASCSAPGVDAVLRFNFHSIASFTTEAERPGAIPYDRWRYRAKLEVSDKASSGVIYRADGDSSISVGPTDRDPVGRWHASRQDAADLALGALVSDVKTISKNP